MNWQTATLFCLVALAAIFTACARQEQLNETNLSMQLANPASVYCGDHGYTLEIRTADDGSQTGYCKFPSGKECEEWAFYRGQCTVENATG